MTIKEVATLFDLTNDTLRYYEKVGLIGPIKKTKSGIRDYSEDDLKRIQFIKCMRSAELSVEVLKKYVNLYEQGDNTWEDRKNLLEEQREILKNKILSMQEAYKKLNNKIELYYNHKLDDYIK